MSTHSHNEHGHGGHELEDFEGTYAIWAIPFSLVMLFTFVLVVTLWVPAAAGKELKIKDTLGAEAAQTSLIEHRAEETEALGDVEASMSAIVNENTSR
jgi:hypothetical protein